MSKRDVKVDLLMAAVDCGKLDKIPVEDEYDVVRYFKEIAEEVAIKALNFYGKHIQKEESTDDGLFYFFDARPEVQYKINKVTILQEDLEIDFTIDKHQIFYLIDIDPRLAWFAPLRFDIFFKTYNSMIESHRAEFIEKPIKLDIKLKFEINKLIDYAKKNYVGVALF
jgi:hypothetical protein